VTRPETTPFPATTPPLRATDLLLIRHAPADNGGLLAGRRDVGAFLPGAAELEARRQLIGVPDRLITSPARRCKMTLEALFGTAPATGKATEDARLWEQDFGLWEGISPADLPDLGPLSRDALAQHRPPQGESFADVCARTTPALLAAASGGRVAVVAHAGVIRAALSWALGVPAAGLGFEIAPLSVTLIRVLPDAGALNFSIAYVNRSAV
jgi:alpha-ribazole phosphatase